MIINIFVNHLISSQLKENKHISLIENFIKPILMINELDIIDLF